MQIILLAGGRGERLRPLTDKIPKPLLPVAGKPVLAYLLEQLTGHDVFVVTGHLVDQYRPLAKQYGFTLIPELPPQGTAGALRLVARDVPLTETFCVSNADEIKRFDLAEMLAFHQKQGSVATIAVTHLADTSGYGQVDIDETTHRIRAFREKATRGQPGWISTGGPYLCEPALLDLIPKEGFTMLEHDVFPPLASRGELAAYPYRGPFHTIDTPERYQNIQSLATARQLGL